MYALEDSPSTTALYAQIAQDTKLHTSVYDHDRQCNHGKPKVHTQSTLRRNEAERLGAAEMGELMITTLAFCGLGTRTPDTHTITTTKHNDKRECKRVKRVNWC